MRNPDLVVIGGGVIGLSVAWRAAREGLSVTVLERDRVGRGTSWVAAGMLAPIAEADPRERRLLDLGLRAMRMYPDFVAELEQEAGRPVGYLRCGALLVARDADEAESITREYAMRRELGLEVERLTPSATRRLEPALSPGIRIALSFAEDHAIDPRRLTAALADAVRRAGGQIREGADVERIMIDAERVTAVRLTGGEQLDTGQVVVAAGPWADRIDGLPEPARLSLRPVKGQILRMHDPSGPGLLTRTLRMLGGYVVPRGDGRYVLGATMEERGYDTTVTAGAVFELLRDTIELLPGASELVIDELSAGIRPATADNVPVLGPGGVDGLHWAAGHYRHGILLAPVTAEIVVQGVLRSGVAKVPA
jgi:glycine oxidase